MPIEHGKLYIAPPGQHLLVERGHVHLSSGPKEQNQRPCINITFRTAAGAYSDRVAGVVLTGEMGDGAAGLWEIKRRGGAAVVQNPEDALFPSMPLSGLTTENRSRVRRSCKRPDYISPREIARPAFV